MIQGDYLLPTHMPSLKRFYDEGPVHNGGLMKNLAVMRAFLTSQGKADLEKVIGSACACTHALVNACSTGAGPGAVIWQMWTLT